MTLQIEELLLMKLLQFFGYVQLDDDIAGSNQEDDECPLCYTKADITEFVRFIEALLL
ncbi:hypothetical protein OS493_033713 [Desmophyllum pertusum]|uniref:Uncharacterized protein n=1 Tax=Desmophyllum pertusum TaxID=174260 RepID=A0A9W9ZJ47_9CNID|nr:hypothetical protein OS493_033713 [Desmophyllum pertusum]